ncbi:MAG: hypothetical protein WCR30_02875 [Clostridia bacterium]
MDFYQKNLTFAVTNLSVNKNWVDAVNEWEILDCIEDESMSSSCVCGKEKLRYLFTITNKLNGNKLYPIGSSCIKKFERVDLCEMVSIKEQLFKLLHAIKSNKYINFDANLFSRKLLKYFLDNSVFVPTIYNHSNPNNDYEFMLNMFNLRSKLDEKQDKRVKAILLNYIKPYLEKILKNKVKTLIEKSF